EARLSAPSSNPDSRARRERVLGRSRSDEPEFRAQVIAERRREFGVRGERLFGRLEPALQSVVGHPGPPGKVARTRSRARVRSDSVADSVRPMSRAVSRTE